ncbi:MULTISPECIES: MCE family protein [unclassified Nocardia]|uniref:MCE family protein n=1 Tax=unclassified Nocardia TaxID=2637762 RepID=UPI0033A4BF76
MTRRSLLRACAALVVVVAVLAGVSAGWRNLFGPYTVRAVFSSATAIYPGDDVRVSGVKVGSIVSIEPHGTTTELVLAVDRAVPVPADARAVIIAQSLVDSRYVQLTPAYRDTGPRLPDGATIPLERTAIPVEWDEIKTQLTRLATDLGPGRELSSSSLGQFVDSAANAMAGNGDALRKALTELSGIGRILADGSGDIVGIIQNLQRFVTALRDSNVQVVEFQNRLASLTSVLDDSRTALDSALTELAHAVTEVQRFVRDNRARAGQQLQGLVNVTQNLVDHRDDLEQLLHIFPTSMANFYNIYNPDTGTESGVFGLNNFSNPVQLVCSAIAGIENTTSAESARKCHQYLGPVLPLLNMTDLNNLPFPINPVLSPAARPENLIYTEPELVPQAVGAPSAPASPPPTLADILFPGGPR